MNTLTSIFHIFSSHRSERVQNALLEPFGGRRRFISIGPIHSVTYVTCASPAPPRPRTPSTRVRSAPTPKPISPSSVRPLHIYHQHTSSVAPPDPPTRASSGSTQRRYSDTIAPISPTAHASVSQSPPFLAPVQLRPRSPKPPQPSPSMNTFYTHSRRFHVTIPPHTAFPHPTSPALISSIPTPRRRPQNLRYPPCSRFRPQAQPTNGGISTVTPPIRTAVPRGTPCHRRSFLRMAVSAQHTRQADSHGPLFAVPSRTTTTARGALAVPLPSSSSPRNPVIALPDSVLDLVHRGQNDPLVLTHPIHADLECTRPARVVNTEKDIGMWFGPSAAAEALRIVVEAFPACGLGVSALSNELLCHTL
ncbi:hypothetical protein B0H13DRAFT_2392883 [Mycena leptocephala]|nr:hypothetical protein B0H13DRAFT_2392883 [Mycena leptocephala]